jgi:hypothetical protein
MMMTLSMGYNYISKPQPLTGTLFIPQMIHEHGEPWWNDVGRGKLLIRPTELSANPISIII